MADTLMINEVFYSIQGESTWAGLPCVFIRLTGCHLRCGYCDTEYAFHAGKRSTIDDAIAVGPRRDRAAPARRAGQRGAHERRRADGAGPGDCRRRRPAAA